MTPLEKVRDDWPDETKRHPGVQVMVRRQLRPMIVSLPSSGTMNANRSSSPACKSRMRRCGKHFRTRSSSR